MRAKELREKTEKELSSLLAASREKLRQLRFDLASKKLKNPNEIKQIKKDIARISTILNAKKHGKE